MDPAIDVLIVTHRAVGLPISQSFAPHSPPTLLPQQTTACSAAVRGLWCC